MASVRTSDDYCTSDSDVDEVCGPMVTDKGFLHDDDALRLVQYKA